LASEELPLPVEPAWIAKIDVEGFELKVLTGMRQALEAKAFVGVSVEINRFTLGLFGVGASTIYEALRACDYVPMQGHGLRDEACYNEFFVPLAV